MRGQLKRTAILLPLVFVIISCVTINVYFPAAAVEKAADKLVDDVWGGGDDSETPAAPQEEGAGGVIEGRTGIFERLSFINIGPRSAEAAEKADINVSTPAIRTLKQSIQARAGAIKPYMNKGNIGIGRNGLLVVRNKSGLNLKQKATLTRLVKSENKDRMALYREIAKANNFTPDRVKDIQKLFAKSWIKNARKGWWIQGSGGAWSAK